MKPWLMLALLATNAFAACPPEDYDRAALQALKANSFEVGDDAARAWLALALLDCLGDPDPALRDGIAFEAQAHWLRGDRLDAPTRRALLASLARRLQAEDDAEGFRKPFAALVLSEVARTDRVAPWLTAEERAALVGTASDYVASIADHRGFTDGQGWRHGVAHGADLLMQLALNPALDKAQLDRLLAAVAAQVIPAGKHAYVHGEPERLARPVLFAAARGLHSQAEWDAWLTALSQPAPLARWADAYASEAGLAQRHNLSAFLRALYVAASESGDDEAKALLPGLRAALAAIS